MISAYVIPGILPKNVDYSVIYDTQKIDAITSSTCLYKGVSMAELTGRRRNREIVEARHIAMYLIRALTTFGVVRIGKLFGRDHTTVIYACENVEALCQTDPTFRNDFESIRSSVKQELLTVGQASRRRPMS